jgi:hypothetical protein
VAPRYRSGARATDTGDGVGEGESLDRVFMRRMAATPALVNSATGPMTWGVSVAALPREPCELMITLGSFAFSARGCARVCVTSASAIARLAGAGAVDIGPRYASDGARSVGAALAQCGVEAYRDS